ncbi:MAG: hypothetical protein CFE44_03915 [Burkholderiales bacterium PBB4]|nr:MAG: hypothetical protein CFE44_03915 [Burkholderiales bacterium PBB4]
MAGKAARRAAARFSPTAASVFAGGLAQSDHLVYAESPLHFHHLSQQESLCQPLFFRDAS